MSRTRGRRVKPGGLDGTAKGRESEEKQVKDENCFSLRSYITLGSFSTSCGLSFLVCKMGRIGLTPRDEERHTLILCEL